MQHYLQRCCCLRGTKMLQSWHRVLCCQVSQAEGTGCCFLFLNPFGLNYANSSFLPVPQSSGTQRRFFSWCDWAEDWEMTRWGCRGKRQWTNIQQSLGARTVGRLSERGGTWRQEKLGLRSSDRQQEDKLSFGLIWITSMKMSCCNLFSSWIAFTFAVWLHLALQRTG